MPSLPWGGLWVARGPCCFPAWHGGAGGNWHVSHGVTAPQAPLCSGGRWGAWGQAVAQTWVSAQLLLSEPRAQYWGSRDVCQALDPGSPRGTAEHPSPGSCVPRSPGYGPACAAGGCGPESPWLSTQPLCLPLHLPGLVSVLGASLLASSHSSLARSCPAGCIRAAHSASEQPRAICFVVLKPWPPLSEGAGGCPRWGRRLGGAMNP